jgi:hypothetical protein
LVEAAIMANLADLALLATPTEFGDIIKGFSQMNRATHAEENEFVQAAVSSYLLCTLHPSQSNADVDGTKYRFWLPRPASLRT